MAILDINDLAMTTVRGQHPRILLDSVTLSVEAGEAVGLVGESGSGKSLTCRSVLRLFPDMSRVTGDIVFDGASVLSMGTDELRRYRRRQVAMIFQDPRAAINPLRTVGDFLVEGLRFAQGLSGNAARRRALELLDSVGISEPSRRLRQHPHEFSGGMLQRVMIASALGSGAQLILADEPTTALDVSTQADVLSLLDELRRVHRVALLFVTHDLDLAVGVCDRIAVMYAGTILEDQPSVALHDAPKHPYTSYLIQCRPAADQRVERLFSIPGFPVSASQAPGGCAFADRCGFVADDCRRSKPQLVGGPQSRVRCIRSEDISPHLVPTRKWVS